MYSLLEDFIEFSIRKGIADKAFIVGGAVRDIILGRELKDVDVAVDGDAVVLAREFAATEKASFVLLDEDFEIARIVKNGKILDLSRLRCNSIAIDLTERDITINAMALPLRDYYSADGAGTHFSAGKQLPAGLLDPLKGADDLAHGVVRMVSVENFIKDPLRLLRAYRFAAEPGFFIEEKTRRALMSLAPAIASVSVERVAVELRYIMGADDSYRVIRAMADDGILFGIFPGMTGRGMLDLYREVEAVLNDLSGSFPWSDERMGPYFSLPHVKPCLKLSCLFPSAGDALAACSGLKMSGKEISFIAAMVENRSSISKLYRDGKPVGSREAVALLRKLREDLYSTAVLTVAGTEPGDAAPADFCRGLVSFYQGPFMNRLGLLPLITGDDLIKEFHIPASPLFKRILGAVEEMVLEGTITSRENALKAAGELISQGH